MTQRLFVYGPLAPGRSNEHFLKDIPGLWQKASLRGNTEPDGWGKMLGYPAIVLDSSADKVDGFVFSSDLLSEHWAELDDFEGECYERVSTMVILCDKSVLEACVYVLKAP